MSTNTGAWAAPVETVLRVFDLRQHSGTMRRGPVPEVARISVRRFSWIRWPLNASTGARLSAPTKGRGSQEGRFSLSEDGVSSRSENGKPFRVVDLNYVSLYFVELQEAISFYTAVFGAPEIVEQEPTIYGWRMGSTWLTLFPSSGSTNRDSNPRNSEFAIQVGSPPELDGS